MYISPTYFYQETRLETGRFWPAKCHRPDHSTALPQRRQGFGLGNLVAGRKLGHLVFVFFNLVGIKCNKDTTSKVQFAPVPIPSSAKYKNTPTP